MSAGSEARAHDEPRPSAPAYPKHLIEELETRGSMERGPHPGPVARLYQRKRSHQVAIVAAPRKLACLFWVLLWRQQDYAFGQPR